MQKNKSQINTLGRLFNQKDMSANNIQKKTARYYFNFLEKNANVNDLKILTTNLISIAKTGPITGGYDNGNSKTITKLKASLNETEVDRLTLVDDLKTLVGAFILSCDAYVTNGHQSKRKSIKTKAIELIQSQVIPTFFPQANGVSTHCCALMIHILGDGYDGGEKAWNELDDTSKLNLLALVIMTYIDRGWHSLQEVVSIFQAGEIIFEKTLLSNQQNSTSSPATDILYYNFSIPSDEDMNQQIKFVNLIQLVEKYLNDTNNHELLTDDNIGQIKYSACQLLLKGVMEKESQIKEVIETSLKSNPCNDLSVLRYTTFFNHHEHCSFTGNDKLTHYLEDEEYDTDAVQQDIYNNENANEATEKESTKSNISNFLKLQYTKNI